MLIRVVVRFKQRTLSKMIRKVPSVPKAALSILSSSRLTRPRVLVSMLRWGLRTDPVALAFGFISEATDPTTFVL